ncbi:SH3 domain-containing protein [Acuticoccus sp.]|uniref:SH3 domain-containing protein n=1 Tax=Acuticoccus sp. TaxID=1904378 RepID=UPI003B5237A4
MHRTTMHMCRCAIAALLAVGGVHTGEAADPIERGPSGLPLPRFVSLASERVNVRRGPSRSYKIKWTFTKSGLPVEIVREFDNWRRVRDADGEEGWIHASLLSGRRTAIVSPWAQGDPVPLRDRPVEDAEPTAWLEPHVLVRINRCDGTWCAIEGADWAGLVPQSTLWGVYPTESVD